MNIKKHLLYGVARGCYFYKTEEFYNSIVKLCNYDKPAKEIKDGIDFCKNCPYYIDKEDADNVIKKFLKERNYVKKQTLGN